MKQDSLTFIFELISVHYPAYSFENRQDVHLLDLPLYDIKAILSLLLHYTCLLNGRDVFTTPLCHSLPQPDQLIIRNFLQRMSKNISKNALDTVLLECIQGEITKNSCWHSFSESTDCQSPLMVLFGGTPVSKPTRLQEKDRIISKLKAELEIEKFDKLDLQSDIKTYVDKNKKLGKYTTSCFW